MGQTPLIEIPNEILGPNEIAAKLIDWDARLNPNQGLRLWSNASRTFVPVPAAPNWTDPAGKPGGILLFIHGTFSKSEAIFDQLAGIERRPSSSPGPRRSTSTSWPSTTRRSRSARSSTASI